MGQGESIISETYLILPEYYESLILWKVSGFLCLLLDRAAGVGLKVVGGTGGAPTAADTTAPHDAASIIGRHSAPYRIAFDEPNLMIRR